MPSWIFKAALQRAIGVLPNATAVNGWFQTHVTRSLELDDDVFRGKLDDARGHIERFARHTDRPLRAALEIGTGWHPALPLALVATGTERVVTHDIVELLTAETVRTTLGLFVTWHERGELDNALPGVDPARIRDFEAALKRPGDSPHALLEPLGIEYRVADAMESGLRDGTVDLVASTVVLEYVPFEPLVELFAEMRRIGAPGAVHSHEIDLADQYHFFDPSISPFHFLRFSDRAWRWISNPLIPMTRMRANDYRRAFADAGLLLADEALDLGDPADLAATPLAERFRDYDERDLLVTRAWFTALNPPESARVADLIGAGEAELLTGA